MKSVTLLKILGVCALSSLAAGAAQAADSCVLSSLERPAESAAAGNTGCREANRGHAAVQNQDLVASIAPLVGGMAKTGIQTASTVMRALSHEAGRLLDE